MKPLALLLSFLFAALSISAQVNPQCPAISIDGPPSPPKPGELILFTVTVKPTESKLSFRWSVDYGEIVEGQGTATVRVRVEKSLPTATVEVGGLPEECPRSASEPLIYDPPPQPTKLDTISLPLNAANNDRLKSIADALNNNPISQLYVLVPTDKSLWRPLGENLFRFTRGIDPSRITYVETNGTNKIAEVWLVPPGATPPSKCEACEPQASTRPDCPKISMEGPPGLTFVGNIMKFTVDKPKEFSGNYKWSVSQGTIESGQGSRSIEVRAPEVPDYVNVTATVELLGLPEKCVNKASETAGVYREFLPTPIDVYGRLSTNDEKARLQYAFGQLGQIRDGVAVLIIRVPKTGKITYESRVQTIKSSLKWLQLDMNKALFVRGDPGELSTTIYLVPREAASSFTKR